VLGCRGRSRAPWGPATKKIEPPARRHFSQMVNDRGSGMTVIDPNSSRRSQIAANWENRKSKIPSWDAAAGRAHPGDRQQKDLNRQLRGTSSQMVNDRGFKMTGIDPNSSRRSQIAANWENRKSNIPSRPQVGLSRARPSSPGAGDFRFSDFPIGCNLRPAA
jgi:hypothetical protein